MTLPPVSGDDARNPIARVVAVLSGLAIICGAVWTMATAHARLDVVEREQDALEVRIQRLETTLHRIDNTVTRIDANVQTLSAPAAKDK